MPDLPLRTLRDLELRYDGPIPAQHLVTEQYARRRTRGTIAVLEAQGTQLLDAAVSCEGEIEDLSADLAERDFAGWQRESAERRLTAARTRLAVHIDSAAKALLEATRLRRSLAMPLHPILAVLHRLKELDTPGEP